MCFLDLPLSSLPGNCLQLVSSSTTGFILLSRMFVLPRETLYFDLTPPPVPSDLQCARV